MTYPSVRSEILGSLVATGTPFLFSCTIDGYGTFDSLSSSKCSAIPVANI